MKLQFNFFKEVKTRTLVEIGVFTALYSALVWGLAPISYWIFQFRIADCLLSLAVRRKHLIIAFTLATALGNILSPFGFLELTWMPFINFIGASSAYLVGKIIRNNFKAIAIGGFVFALWITFGVASMLNYLLGVPFYLLFLYILIPELITIVGASPAMAVVSNYMEKY